MDTNLLNHFTFEIFNGNVHGNTLMNPRGLNARTLNRPKQEKAITILNSEHNIYPESNDMWTFIFSVQPNNQTDLRETVDGVEISCFDSDPNINRRIRITWIEILSDIRSVVKTM